MNKLIVLDTNVLGMVTNPKNTNPIWQECKEWLDELENAKPTNKFLR